MIDKLLAWKLPIPTPQQLFSATYLLIAAATFRHSAVGFASLEGSIFWGALSALAIDVLMILFAHAIREAGLKLNWESAGLLFGLTVTALGSVYTQLLFAVIEAQELTVAPGAAWLEQTAVNITNVRVVLLPMLLPVMAVVTALAGKYNTAPTVSQSEHTALKAQLAKAQVGKNELDRLREANTEHERRLARLRSDEATKTVGGLIRAWGEEVWTNGNAPTSKVLERTFGVTRQTVSKAMGPRKVEE